MEFRRMHAEYLAALVFEREAYLVWLGAPSLHTMNRWLDAHAVAHAAASELQGSPFHLVPESPRDP
jgi:hypothetical protein